MAQTGYTPIQLYYSTTASQAPLAASLANGELAINITDGKLFYKDNAAAVQVIGWKTTPTSAGGTGLTSYTAGDTLYYASGTTLTKLAIGATGHYLSSTGSAPQWSAPAALTKTDDTNVTLTLGGSPSTALLNAASLTLGWTGTLATTRGGTGLSSFTANGIVYASSTSALATGSALTFDGTNLATTGSIAFANVSNGIGVTGTFTRNSGTASGNVSYTGVGFKPSLVVFYAAIDTLNDFMIGGGTASAGRTLYNNFGNSLGANSQAVAFYYRRDIGGGNFDIQSATIASMDSDGFTLAYTRTRGGTGTGNSIIVNYIAYK